MKMLVLFLIFIAPITSCFSQQNVDSFPVIKKTYLEKSKSQKTLGFVFLGGGALLNVIALATFPKDYYFIDWGNSNTASEESRANTSTALFLAGSVSMLGSIPFFIVSKVNKKRSLNVRLNNQQLYQVRNRSMQTLNYPAVTMTVKL